MLRDEKIKKNKNKTKQKNILMGEGHDQKDFITEWKGSVQGHVIMGMLGTHCFAVKKKKKALAKKPRSGLYSKEFNFALKMFWPLP